MSISVFEELEEEEDFFREGVAASLPPKTPRPSESKPEQGKCVQEYLNGSQIAKNMLDSYDPDGCITNEGLLCLQDAILHPAEKQILGGNPFILTMIYSLLNVFDFFVGLLIKVSSRA